MFLERFLNFWNFHRLDKTGYPQGTLIQKALRELNADPSEEAQSWIEKIERERKNLMGNAQPLIDGHLGSGGIYDQVNQTVADACKVSKPRKPARFLYHLARRFQPKKTLELGTNVGISSAYLAAALPQGQLTTLESSAYRQQIARKVHESLGLKNITYTQGLFADTLADVLKQMGSVDFVFVDGHHLYEATIKYFEMIFPFASPSAVFVFDDIRWSDGMKKAWAHLCQDKHLGLLVDLHSLGIGVCADPSLTRRQLIDIRRNL